MLKLTYTQKIAKVSKVKYLLDSLNISTFAPLFNIKK